MSQERGTHLEVGGLIISIAPIRLDLVIRGGIPTELVGTRMPLFRLTECSEDWRLSLHKIGLVGGSVGVLLLPGGIPVRAGWSEALGLDDSQARLAQDLIDMRMVRGFPESAPCRNSAWEVMISGADASIPVGIFSQIHSKVLLRFECVGRRPVLQIFDGTQFLYDLRTQFKNGNLKPDFDLQRAR